MAMARYIELASSKLSERKRGFVGCQFAGCLLNANHNYDNDDDDKLAKLAYWL